MGGTLVATPVAVLCGLLEPVSVGAGTTLGATLVADLCEPPDLVPVGAGTTLGATLVADLCGASDFVSLGAEELVFTAFSSPAGSRRTFESASDSCRAIRSLFDAELSISAGADGKLPLPVPLGIPDAGKPEGNGPEPDVGPPLCPWKP